MIELFSELYNCYFQVVKQILKTASLSPVTRQAMEETAREKGYEESALVIVPKLLSGEWNLMEPAEDGYLSKVDNPDAVPLSVLQKQWLKALLMDKRIQLFFSAKQLETITAYLKPVNPLFSPEDFLYFDRYADGDPYEQEFYKKHFLTSLKAVKEHRMVSIHYFSGKHNLLQHFYLPCRIEYSSKDDKFRLLCLFSKSPNHWRLEVINMARILKIEETTVCIPSPPDINEYLESSLCKKPVVLRITNERNALERTMLHFASYEKRTERIEGTNQYLCSLYYNKAVETELVIQILSFGPVVQVLGPDSFLAQIRERIRKQLEL